MFDRVLAGLLIFALGCTCPFAQADTSLPAWEGPPEHFTPHTADTTTLSGALAWLQTLSEDASSLGRRAEGPSEYLDMGFRGPVPPPSTLPQGWSIEALNATHSLDLSGLDYDSGELFHLSALTNLHALRMGPRTNRRGQGQDLDALWDLEHLQHLDVQGYGLTAEGIQQIAQVSSLRSLRLDDATLGWQDLLHLQALPELAYLDPGEQLRQDKTPEAKAWQQALKAALPGCHIVGLEHAAEKSPTQS